MADLKISYGDIHIPYTINRLENRRGKIKINVCPDGIVSVDAPIDSSEKAIRDAIYKRARWVYGHVKSIKDQQQYVLPRKYVSGESHFYLGKRYPLKVRVRKRLPPVVKLLHGKFEIIAPDKDATTISDLLSDWYRIKAEYTFYKRLEDLKHSVVWLKHIPNIKLRVMKRQWGSCTPKGTIILNPHLVKASRECIDYVILHELCHLKEHNHSPKFYRMLDKHMPDWRTTKEKLDSMAAMLLAQ